MAAIRTQKSPSSSKSRSTRRNRSIERYYTSADYAAFAENGEFGRITHSEALEKDFNGKAIRIRFTYETGIESILSINSEDELGNTIGRSEWWDFSQCNDTELKNQMLGFTAPLPLGNSCGEQQPA